MQQLIAGIALGVFLVIMIVIGINASKKTQSMNAFLLGGRNIGPWMSAFAYGTSYFSAVIFIGYAGKTGWDIGLGGICIGLGNALLGSFMAWKVLAKRTRTMTHTLRASTMPEFFQGRYDSRLMKLASAIIIFIFLVPYSASVYMGLGYLFNSIFPNIAYEYCMLFMAVLTAVYLVLGGYIASAVNDFVQGIIMIAGVIIMLWFIISHPHVNGLAEGMARLKAIDPDLVSVLGGKSWLNLLSMVLLTSFGTWALPQMVHKFYAIKDVESIPRATIISTLFAFIIGTGAYFAGAFGRLFLNDVPMLNGVKNYDMIMPDMLNIALSGNVLSNIVLSVILLLVLSASMSTLSAIVLTSSSAVSVDLVKGYFKPDISDKSSMLLTRLLCVLFVAFSFLVASMKISFIIALMSFSWGVVSGCFIGPYIWGLYSKKTTRAGAWAGMCAGFLTMMILVVSATLFTEGGFATATARSPLFGVISMAVSFAIVPLVSMFTHKYKDEHIARVFQKNGV